MYKRGFVLALRQQIGRFSGRLIAPIPLLPPEFFSRLKAKHWLRTRFALSTVAAGTTAR
ncbi:MAG: hypothetical protein V4623_01525 [Pseudomonadota bacterium]